MSLESSFYRFNPSNNQVNNIGQKFQELDTNGDSALSKNELKSIFTNVSDTELDGLVYGIDNNDDSFIDYNEFSKALINFDIDKDGEISSQEIDIIKQKIAENEKQEEINQQYKILSSILSSPAQKAEAEEKIPILKKEQLKIVYDSRIDTQSIEIAAKQSEITEIETLINSGTLSDFDVAKKIKEKNYAEAEVTVFNLEKNINIKKYELHDVELQLLLKIKEKKAETDAAKIEKIEKQIEALEYEQIAKEYSLSESERALEIYHSENLITHNENKLKKFFISDVEKTNINKKLDLQRDELLILKDRAFMSGMTTILSAARKDYINLGLEAATSEEIQAKAAEINDAEKYTTFSVIQLDLHDSQVRLKNVLARAETNANVSLKNKLIVKVEELQAQYDSLLLNLPGWNPNWPLPAGTTV